jgi:hypothetical protein
MRKNLEKIFASRRKIVDFSGIRKSEIFDAPKTKFSRAAKLKILQAVKNPWIFDAANQRFACYDFRCLRNQVPQPQRLSVFACLQNFQFCNSKKLKIFYMPQTLSKSSKKIFDFLGVRKCEAFSKIHRILMPQTPRV